ncbi:MAG TPA: 1,4-dihydroxy-2-naphthoate polyprenyltransferase [Chloroflexota bacterium]|jgi:1,4-dihydroxy-2-naphthoate octaprenyltransferase|nr:1,4-dihydroxy-2-naphthoate polyprenyltransferase [Chloroflexota bacterium]
MSRRPSQSQPSLLQTWLIAARPPTLSAAVVPVLVGTAVAHLRHPFRPVPFVLALLAAVLIQVGTNFVNDYYDFRKGADTGKRLGPVRGLQTGAITSGQMRNAIFITFGAALLIGVYLVATHGLPILLIGVVSILAGIGYTAGPRPIAYIGLGDIFVFIFFGMVGVVGSAFLQMDAASAAAAVAAVPVGLLATAILVVNNLRDADTDRAAGKFTLAVLLGRTFVQAEFMVCLVVAYLAPLAMRLSGALPTGLWWLPWLTLPLAAPLVRTVLTSRDGPRLNQALRETGQLHLLFGVLLAGSFL